MAGVISDGVSEKDGVGDGDKDKPTFITKAL
jgi:hypothetical protein